MNLFTVYKTKLEIGISETAGVWTYAQLCKGIDNVSFANGETKQQYYFFCGNGFPTDHITALAPVLSVSGRRVFGDAAQDYIAGLSMQVDTARNSSVRLTQYDEDGNPEVTTSNCVISNIINIGGASTEDTVFSFDICLNGTPAQTNIAPLGALTVVSVAGVTAGKTAVYVNPALTGTDTYQYMTAATVTLPALGVAPAWTVWNGTDEITATAGNQIGIVEVDTSGNAVKGGVALVTVG